MVQAVVRVPFWSCILRSLQRKHVLLVQLFRELLQLLRVLIGKPAEPCRSRGLAPVAEAVAIALAAQLKPEAGRVFPSLQLVLE